MSVKVIYRGKRYALKPNEKYDWSVRTMWGNTPLNKRIEKGKRAKNIVKELKLLQKRTPVELDYMVTQLPVKRKLKKVM